MIGGLSKPDSSSPLLGIRNRIRLRSGNSIGCPGGRSRVEQIIRGNVPHFVPRKPSRNRNPPLPEQSDPFRLSVPRFLRELQRGSAVHGTKAHLGMHLVESLIFPRHGIRFADVLQQRKSLCRDSTSISSFGFSVGRAVVLPQRVESKGWRRIEYTAAPEPNQFSRGGIRRSGSSIFQSYGNIDRNHLWFRIVSDLGQGSMNLHGVESTILESDSHPLSLPSINAN